MVNALASSRSRLAGAQFACPIGKARPDVGRPQPVQWASRMGRVEAARGGRCRLWEYRAAGARRATVRAKKCPREAGSFGVGAYAQTCCASLQGGRQRSRIRKCAIAKNSEWQRPVVPASRRRPDSSGEPVAGVDFLSGDISRSIGRILPPGVVARKRQRRIAVRRCRDTGGPASLCFSAIVSLIARADACVRRPQGVDVRQRKAKAAAQPWRNL